MIASRALCHRLISLQVLFLLSRGSSTVSMELKDRTAISYRSPRETGSSETAELHPGQKATFRHIRTRLSRPINESYRCERHLYGSMVRCSPNAILRETHAFPAAHRPRLTERHNDLHAPSGPPAQTEPLLQTPLPWIRTKYLQRFGMPLAQRVYH